MTLLNGTTYIDHWIYPSLTSAHRDSSFQVCYLIVILSQHKPSVHWLPRKQWKTNRKRWSWSKQVRIQKTWTSGLDQEYSKDTRVKCQKRQWEMAWWGTLAVATCCCIYSASAFGRPTVLDYNSHNFPDSKTTVCADCRILEDVVQINNFFKRCPSCNITYLKPIYLYHIFSPDYT